MRDLGNITKQSRGSTLRGTTEDTRIANGGIVRMETEGRKGVVVLVLQLYDDMIRWVILIHRKRVLDIMVSMSHMVSFLRSGICIDEQGEV